MVWVGEDTQVIPSFFPMGFNKSFDILMLFSQSKSQHEGMMTTQHVLMEVEKVILHHRIGGAG